MTDYPDFRLDGQTALVTGAARGLGRAISLALAEAGADVALGLRVGGDAQDLASEIEAMGRRALRVQMDLLDLGQIEAAVTEVRQAFGRIDVLDNNAGIGPEEQAAEDWTEADFDATFDLNVKGLFFASQEVARVMIEQGGGRIVNMSSQAGLIALPGEAIYCATKAAVSHLTKCHAVEWGKYGINVNAVAPTFIRTPGTEPMLADAGFKADVEERIAALHRIGEPVDVAGAVVYLASPASSLVTGTTLMVDGGWTAR
jgi:NAD(P)-dependent dehydrogenase (short-subunit alcohol dehydrogenase family)